MGGSERMGQGRRVGRVGHRQVLVWSVWTTMTATFGLFGGVRSAGAVGGETQAAPVGVAAAPPAAPQSVVVQQSETSPAAEPVDERQPAQSAAQGVTATADEVVSEPASAPITPVSAVSPLPATAATATVSMGSPAAPTPPPAVTGEREADSGLAQAADPRPETAVSALPMVPAPYDDGGAERDRGFPASSLQLGGGVSEFSRGQMRSEAARGPYWDLRGVIGLRRLLAFEAALTGAAYPMAGERYGGDATLVRNGFEASTRFNLPVEEKAGLILLYGSAGLGWANYRVMAADMTGMVKTDNAATLPLAAGITFGYERFLVDVRLGYRFVFRDELLASNAAQSSPPEENRLRDYSIGAQLGYEF